jgi:hypothetical protein
MPRHNQPKRKAQGHKTPPKTEQPSEVIRFIRPIAKTSAPLRVGQTIEDWKASLGK